MIKKAQIEFDADDVLLIDEAITSIMKRKFLSVEQKRALNTLYKKAAKYRFRLELIDALTEISQKEKKQ